MMSISKMSNLKLYALGVSSVAITLLLNNNRNETLIKIGSLVGGAIAAPLIEVIDDYFELVEKKIETHGTIYQVTNEVFESGRILSCSIIGMTTGTVLGTVVGKIFNYFPIGTLNGLILLEGILFGASVGHGLDLYSRNRLIDEVPSVTANTMTGLTVGFVTGVGVILRNEIMNITNSIMSTEILTNIEKNSTTTEEVKIIGVEKDTCPAVAEFIHDDICLI